MVSVLAVLAAATAVAARTCDLPRVTGRLEPGLAADLLFVQGNLERDITALQRPDTVFIRGNPLPRVRDPLEQCS